MMADFECVEWDADTQTDQIIQGLFQPVLSKEKKRKKLHAKMQESCPNFSKENLKNNGEENGARYKQKQKGHPQSRQKKRQQQQEKEKIVKEAGSNAETPIHSSSNNIPKKSKKNKYYTLSLLQKQEKGGTVVKDTEIVMPESNEIQDEDTQPNDIPNRHGYSGKASKGTRKYTIEASREKSDSDEVSMYVEKKHMNSSDCVLETQNVAGGGKISKSYNVKKGAESQQASIQQENYNSRKHKIPEIGEKKEDAASKKQKVRNSEPVKKSMFKITRLKAVLSMDKVSNENNESTSKNNKPKEFEGIVNKETSSLKEKMSEQLKSGRFRYINEQLYSTSGSSAYELFKNDPDSFIIYHEGFQQQVSKWPANPLDKMIQYVKERPSSYVVADFGCGDGRLAESVSHNVYSFDLVATKPHITACDMAHVPLKAGTVDICVFCLSLMGTNLLDYLLEAHRILKKNGVLLIAEVSSRFGKIVSFVKKLKKLGFFLLNKDTSDKMFVFFEFKKKTGYDKTRLPDITLEPCVYKKR